MKDKLHSSIRGASKGEGIPHDILNYTSSVIDPETSEALSEKISSMLPNIGTIRATGIIKNTDSFQESKDLLTNFKTSLHKLNKDVMKEPDYSYEKSDGRSALEHATDAIERVVVFMTRANIEVPSIYHEFLSQVRPKKIESPDVCIEKKEPLYKITGLNENGEVKIETDTPLILKKGKTEIALTNEKLKETLFNSQKVDSKMIQDLHTWVKNNLHRAGTLEKIDDVEWKNLRQSIIDNYNQRKRSETTVCEKDYPMSAKIDEILSATVHHCSSHNQRTVNIIPLSRNDRNISRVDCSANSKLKV